MGDPIRRDSEAGRLGDTISGVHTRGARSEEQIHHTSRDEAQHEIQSDGTDPIAMHEDTALKRKRAS